MAKEKTLFECESCGADFLKWAGQCAQCGEWNTLVEKKSALVVGAYEFGVLRREEARRRATMQNEFSVNQAEFIDIALTNEAFANGRTISALTLPRDAVLVSIRRGSQLIIPHGDTQLQAGDVVKTAAKKLNPPSTGRRYPLDPSPAALHT